MFAKCRSSDTRQNQSLPSASDETLGKHNFAECLKKYTRQTSSRAPHAPVTVGWRSGRYCLPSAGYGTLGKPSKQCHVHRTRLLPRPLLRYPDRYQLPRPLQLLVAECRPWDTRQRSLNAECIMLALGIQLPLPSVFFGSRQS